MVTKLLSFKTRQQQVAARKSGKTVGHFGWAAKGRPVVAKGKDRPMNMTVKEVIAKGKNGDKTSCFNWNLPGNFNPLEASVIAHVKARESAMSRDEKQELQVQLLATSDGIIPANQPITPRSALQRHTDEFLAVAKKKNCPLEHLCRDDIFPKSRGGGKGLLDDNDIELLTNSLICCHGIGSNCGSSFGRKPL